MTNLPIPPGYHTVTPYIIANDARQLLRFLEQAFGATTTVPPLDRPDGSIMHTEVQVGTSRIMLAGATEQWSPRPATIFLYVPDVDASYRRALEAGGTSIMPVADQFHGDRMGGVEDPTGSQWWIASHIEDVSAEELERRRVAHLATLASATA